MTNTNENNVKSLIIKTKEYYEKKDYLKKIGIKSRSIYKFLQNDLTNDEIKFLNLIQTFRKYLKTFENITLNEAWSEEEEVNNYKIFGFTSIAANKYVKKLKKIYTKDSTINWVFRIAESKVNKDSEKIFKDYLKRFNSNNTLNRSSNIKNKCDQCLKFDEDCEKCNQCAMVCCKSCIGMNDEKCQVCLWFDSLAE